MKHYCFSLFFLCVLAISVTQAQKMQPMGEPFSRQRLPEFGIPFGRGDSLLRGLNREVRAFLPPGFEQMSEPEKQAVLRRLPPHLRRVESPQPNMPNGRSFKESAPLNTQSDFWQQTNGPYGGDVTALAASPDGAGGINLFAGTERGSVYLSTNYGNNWTNYGSNFFWPIYALMAAPNGLGGMNLFVGTYAGIVYSDDNGNSWKWPYTIPFTRIHAFALSPDGVGGSILFASAWDTVYRSTDNGQNWTSSSNGLTGSYFNSFTVNSGGTGPSGTSLFVGGDSGVFISNDNGNTWTATKNGLTNSSVTSLASSQDGAGDNNLFAGTRGGGVFISTNNGVNWTAANSGLPSGLISDLAISSDGVGGTKLLAATDSGIFLSTNNGSNWIKTNNQLSRVWYAHDIIISPDGTGGTKFLAATDSGIILSSNNGANWDSANTGLTDYDVAALAFSGPNLLAGTREHGIFISTNNGTTWNCTNNGLNIYFPNSFFRLPDGAGSTNLYAGGDGVNLSTNNGASWTPINLPYEVFSLAGISESLGSQRLFAACWNAGIFLSTDNGGSWTAVNNGLLDLDISALVVSPSPGGGSKLFAASADSGIYLSTNYGETWVSASNGLPRDWIWTLAAFQDNAGGTSLFAGTMSSGLFRSTDDGSTWTMITGVGDFGIYEVHSIVASPDGIGGTNLIVGTSNGVFLSTDDGVSWSGLRDGMGYRNVLSLVLDSTDGHLYAGASLGGVFRSTKNQFYGSISGFAFNDQNANGVIEDGEPLLENWRIRLFKDGIQIDSTMTTLGGYKFKNLDIGTFIVNEESPPGWIQSSPSVTNYTITLGVGDTTTGRNKNFGNYRSNNINGISFFDMNENRTRDKDELGLSGWKIILSGSKIDSTVTDTNGYYHFIKLPKGTYTVREQTVRGWLQTVPDIPGTYSIQLLAGKDTSNFDFGNYLIGTIYGVMFNDLNGNGVKDAGESNLENWRIRLFKGGVQIDSTLTTHDGYRFNNLDSGTYVVREQSQAGWIQTSPSSISYTITLGIGDTVNGKDKDFGSFIPGSISGIKFFDIIGNRVRDEGDPGLPGWRIRLSGQRVDSTLTDSLGVYHFNNLPAGTYTITEQQQIGWLRTVPDLPGVYTVNLSAARDTGGFVFGNYSLGQISGIKFNDLNGNGTREYNEPGLAGFKIRLSGPKNDSTLTSSNGAYTFLGVPSGMYTVSEELQSGWVQTMPDSPKTYSIVMVTSGNFPNNNFGTMHLSAIRGMVFSDLNGNGIKDSGETSNRAILVRLSGAKADTTFTDSIGQYGFSNLMPGVYSVMEEPISPCSQSYPQALASYTITIMGDTIVLGCNFGNQGICNHIAVSCSMARGWNLMSLPVFIWDGIKTSVLPGAISEAFAYEGTYRSMDIIQPERGYWLKFASDSVYDFIGFPIVQESIAVATGWNLIGSLTTSIGVRTFATEPEAMISSPVFGYQPASGYTSVDTIKPGKGYWIKVNTDGLLILSATAEKTALHRINIVASDEQPPLPPEDEITDATKFLPARFELLQSYPNPFNPSTTISYQLPVDSKVMLRVYNVLGQVEATLVNEMQSSGFKSATWNAIDIPSGIYFYRLDGVSMSDPGTSFTQIRKMILLK